MPIDHSRCTHPRTPAGRRACRAGRNPLVRLNAPETPQKHVRDRSNEVAPTKAMADLLGMSTPPAYDVEPWLTSEAVIRNGGIRPTGTEGMKSSIGSKKSTRVPRKSTYFTEDHSTPVEDAPHPRKPITNDRVITSGFYLHEDKIYQVKLGRDSNKPYAVHVTPNNPRGEYVPGMMNNLRASELMEPDDVAVAIPALDARREPVKPGFYQLDDTIYKVKISRSSGKPYALAITEEDTRGTYAPGVVFKLTDDMKLTEERAAVFGQITGMCCICSRTLTDPTSIERGIGPVCAGKMGW